LILYSEKEEERYVEEAMITEFANNKLDLTSEIEMCLNLKERDLVEFGADGEEESLVGETECLEEINEIDEIVEEDGEFPEKELEENLGERDTEEDDGNAICE
jgi:hypothetical protein